MFSLPPILSFSFVSSIFFLLSSPLSSFLYLSLFIPPLSLYISLFFPLTLLLSSLLLLSHILLCVFFPFTLSLSHQLSVSLFHPYSPQFCFCSPSSSCPSIYLYHYLSICHYASFPNVFLPDLKISFFFFFATYSLIFFTSTLLYGHSFLLFCFSPFFLVFFIFFSVHFYCCFSFLHFSFTFMRPPLCKSRVHNTKMSHMHLAGLFFALMSSYINERCAMSICLWQGLRQSIITTRFAHEWLTSASFHGVLFPNRPSHWVPLCSLTEAGRNRTALNGGK
ncbi:unnamed protein product [Acanthosepion pharaonis]|uniref:Uncharacterized protein n=1 Tax=Acanthosepion pharaonis TaxID=158019 RepID=A0A812DY81_ACAPH|nr:unnamed protein product [Sepia pharaonis]